MISLRLISFPHSDLALRNCLLSANVSVKIGDYGLSHIKYKVGCVYVCTLKHCCLRFI